MPPAAPITKAKTVSTRVIHRCPQISPVAKSRKARASTSRGVEKKNWICRVWPRIG
jgi:hypothetical protein